MQQITHSLDTRESDGYAVAPRTTVLKDERFVFLDNLRAIAALSVFLFHAGLQVSPAFEGVMNRYLNFGSFGVLVFFLCSGYIIPAAIERSRSLGRFWVRRIFRLYPLYWFSIGIAVLFHAIGLGATSGAVANATTSDILLQATMLQPLLEQPYFVAVYWTLWYEMVFYCVVSVLFVLRLLKPTLALSVGLLGLAILLEVVLPAIFGYEWTSKMTSYIGIMFVGTLMYRAHQGEAKLSHANLVFVLALLTLCLTNISRLGLGAAVPVITAHFAALLLFRIALLVKLTRVPSLLTKLGYMSYSIYLIHPFVFLLIPHQQRGLAMIGVWQVVVLLLAFATYQLIEEPTRRVGQYLTRQR